MKTINSLEEVKINGIKQWIYIRSKNISNPIILFLHGGPGVSHIYCIKKYFEDLEDHFVVVDWDQRGSGKSYSEKIPKETYNINQYIEDVRVLAELLATRFNKDKIFLACHSWGSIIGLLAVHKYPHLFQCYIGIGQVVNIVEGDSEAFNHVLEQAKLKNDDLACKMLQKIGPPPHDSLYKSVMFRIFLHKYADVNFKETLLLWKDFFIEMLFSKEYSLMDSVKWLKGINYSGKRMKKEMLSINFIEQIKKVKVPVYFLAGRFDYITPSSLVEEYYKIIESPYKKMIYFENAAHNLHFEDTDKFIQVCCDIAKRHA
ncbi:alpha/beta fold hydrolase [Lederbergia citrea]|uniref:Alpha/beta hydrolase n=1 Tax=Lederbergia citrea TaxID=2833581 RepID=A0A942UN93_9BACI|nr:alpha/beta hydrolase [Lederbergia citrea]MBS4206081.1 alpha/beta hydrolase [Lederbergia citrea]MBS4224470.1 alpha/beta hydrolase [Lederbergia citrea]